MQAFHYDTIDSTNEEARRLIHAGRIAGPAYVLAREQTAGKGSRGRKWVSPKDAGVYLSVVETPHAPTLADVTVLTLAAGVACAEALRETVDVCAELKPINDLYVDGRKLGGILTETIVQGDVLEAVIVGVGINIKPSEQRVLPEDGVGPISVFDLVAPHQRSTIDPDALVKSLVEKIRRWVGVVLAGGADEVREAWEAHKVPGTSLPGGE